MDSSELPPKRGRRRAAAVRREPTAEEVAIRAYQIHQEHGCVHGRDVEDWLQAERELREELQGP